MCFKKKNKYFKHFFRLFYVQRTSGFPVEGFFLFVENLANSIFKLTKRREIEAISKKISKDKKNKNNPII